MNIIIKEQKNSRIIDGINEILSLDDKSFKEVINKLLPQGEILENIRFFYTTDKCEVPENNIQLGLEKNVDKNGNFISRGYFGGEYFSIQEIFKNIEDKLKDLPEDSLEYYRPKQLLRTRDLNSLKLFMLDEKRRR